MGGTATPDVEEVLNYIDALNWGRKRLCELPLSNRLLREMHARVLAGVRGRKRQPGEIRNSQNWIGDVGSTIDTATFVPPPQDELSWLLDDWEKFANEDGELPLLIQGALLHYQFETIHPFLDGNGRLGRALIVFFLIARRRLIDPLLYLSSYFEQERQRYYGALQQVREQGEIETWLALFLTGVKTQATDAVIRANSIVQLRERYRTKASKSSTTNVVALIDLIFETPILTARMVQRRLHVTRPTALSLLRQLVSEDILAEEETRHRSQLKFIARDIINILT